MIKKIKFGLILVGISFGLLSIFVSPVRAEECPSFLNGSTRCMNAIFQRCDNGEWTKLYECPNKKCSLGFLTCYESCQPAVQTNRCVDGVSQECGDDGGWKDLEKCPNGCAEVGPMCASSENDDETIPAVDCPSYLEGAIRCMNAIFQRCENGKWKDLYECPNKKCSLGFLTCYEECLPFEKNRCKYGILQKCSNGGWEDVEKCPIGCAEDNITCASDGGSPYGQQTTDESTYTPPENEDGSPYGSSYKSEIIPSYGTTGFKFENKKIGSIVTKLLDYVYVITGLILLVMLVTGGLGLMTAAGNPDKMKAGYGKITNSLIGFLIIFISYFVVQLIETVLSIKIF